MGAILFASLVAVANPAGATKARPDWKPSHALTVWVKEAATPAQEVAIGTALAHNPALSGCSYRTPLAVYEQAVKLLPKDELAKLTPANVPASFRCTIQRHASLGTLVRTYTALPGVLQVVVPDDTIRR